MSLTGYIQSLWQTIPNPVDVVSNPAKKNSRALAIRTTSSSSNFTLSSPDVAPRAALASNSSSGSVFADF